MADIKKVNLDTRIALKIDTLEAWGSSSIVLEKGEVALAILEANAAYGITEPVVMAKIGDGDHTFSQISDWNFYAKASDVIAACKSEAGLTAFVNTVINSSALTDNAAFVALTGRVSDTEGAINTLKGTGEGSVAKAISDAITTAVTGLDATVASADVEVGKGLKVTVVETDGVLTSVSLEGNFDNVYSKLGHHHTVSEIDDFDSSVKAYDYATKTEAQGYANAKDSAIAAAQKAGDDAMAEAQKKVASVAAGDASVTIGGTATAPTVATKLSADADNAITLEDDGLKVVIPAAAEYSIVKAADSGDYAAVYNLTKDGTVVGASINIPKDMVVKSGSVVDGNIVLVLNDDANTEITIPASSLIEYVTSGSATGDMVVVSVSDDHKVTATISDGTITLAKLTTEVQTAINKAHVHDNKSVIDGISAQNITDWNDAVAKEHEHANKSLLDTYTQTEADLADAVAKKHNHANKDVLDGITAQNITDWNDAVAKEHEHANKSVIDGITAEKVGNWDTAYTKATTALQTAGDGLVVDGTKVSIDTNTVFVFNCGSATEVI